MKLTHHVDCRPVESGDPESVTRTVCQALQAGQVSLVAKIVSTSSLSQDFIQKTVALLPAESVLPLLAVIQSKFEKGMNKMTPLPLSINLMLRLCGRTEPRSLAEVRADWSRRLPDVSG